MYLFAIGFPINLRNNTLPGPVDDAIGRLGKGPRGKRKAILQQTTVSGGGNRGWVAVGWLDGRAVAASDAVSRIRDATYHATSLAIYQSGILDEGLVLAAVPR